MERTGTRCPRRRCARSPIAVTSRWRPSPTDDRRPATCADSPSGTAAAIVRDRWDVLRRAGHLDDPRLEDERAPVRWHLGTFIAGVVLLAAGIVSSV